MEHDLSSSSSAACWRYHVFLSFRGPDTRQGFTGHLYAALERKGLTAFIDDERVRKGENITPELLQAIEESLCVIVILSPNYASSTWCLDELVKILECQKHLGRFVCPIFYGIDPSDIRRQRGSIAKAFLEHEKQFRKSIEKVQRWRQALVAVANLSGWEYSQSLPEAKLIKEVVQSVWEKVSLELPSYYDGLVGIDSRLEEINSLLRMDSDDVHFIGIWGMDGIGKSAIARIIYERIRGQFEMSCFLANVSEACKRSDGLVELQRKILSHLGVRSTEIEDVYDGKKIIRNLLCRKRILLVLDDISATSQLENLAEKTEWFGPGSRVIITTRDVNLLMSQGGLFEKYKVEILNPHDSLQLFCQNAFKRDQPEEDYLELSKIAVEYAGGNPLALKVLGQFLYGRGVSEWEDALGEVKEEIVTFLRAKLIKKSPLQSLGTMKLPKFRAEEAKDQILKRSKKKVIKREMKEEDETTGWQWDGIDESVKESEASLISKNGEQKQTMMIEQEDEIVASDDETKESFVVEHCPDIILSKEEEKRLYEPWRHSLIVKQCGRKAQYEVLLRHLQALWGKEGKFSVIELENDYFVVKFTKEEDYLSALHSSSWWLAPYLYILVQIWRPGFDPFEDEVRYVPVWIRIPRLPLEYYDKKLLWRVGNCLGKTLTVDINLSRVSRPQCARICVELDLNKRPILRFQLKKKIYSVEYEENLITHRFCFKCGKFDHKQESCPLE